MSGAVTVAAPAKINLSLGVGTRRADGFHPLATVYQAIGLYDRVTVTDADDLTVSVTADPRIPVDGVPLDDTNIAVRAARSLREHTAGSGAARTWPSRRASRSPAGWPAAAPTRPPPCSRSTTCGAWAPRVRS